MAKRPPLTLKEYFVRTRGRSFSAIVTVTLLVVYEAGLVLADETRRNAADVLLKDLLDSISPHAIQVFHVGLLLLFSLALFIYWSRSRSIVRYILPFVAECMVYAMCLAPAVFFVTNPRLATPGGDLLLDIGAGVYEEILFRLIMLRGLSFLIGIDPYIAFFEEDKKGEQSALQVSSALILPVLVSAAAFSGYHHIGPNADPLVWSTFMFRFVAGLLLALLYFTRGLGVCVYTHAIYDLMLHTSLLR